MKIFKSIGLIFIGMILGIVLFFGGAALIVYKTASKPGSMTTVNKIVSPVLPVKWDEEIQSKSAREYLSLVSKTFSNLSTTEIAQIEQILGGEIISKQIENTIGIPKEKTKASILKDLGSTISENLTMSMAKEKMKLNLGDMKLFKNEEFLNTPLNVAFKDITSYNLDEFINIVYDAEATPEKPASKPIVQKIGKKPVKDLGTEFDAVVSDSMLRELVKVTDASPRILKYLADTKVKDLNTTINNMALKDMILIEESSHNIMKKLQDLTVTQLSDSSVTTPILEGMTIGELVKVNEDSPLLLKSLQDTQIKDMSEKIDTLTLAEVYDNPNQGPLSIIDPNTRLQDIPAVIALDMPNASLYALNKAGIFNITEPTTIGGKVRSYNTTMQQAVEQYSNAASGDGGGTIASKRYLVYLYDDATLFTDEQNNDNPYADGIAMSIVRYYNIAPGYQQYFTLHAIKIDDITVDDGNGTQVPIQKNLDGFYEITDEVLSKLWKDSSDNPTRIPNGAELILQRGVSVQLEGDPNSEDNTYSSIFSVTGLYEHLAYVAGYSPVLTDFCSQANHGTIRVGKNIKMRNRVGGYSYFRNVEGKIETMVTDTYVAYINEDDQPEIIRNMVSPSPTTTNPTPIPTPNHRIDYLFQLEPTPTP